MWYTRTGLVGVRCFFWGEPELAGGLSPALILAPTVARGGGSFAPTVGCTQAVWSISNSALLSSEATLALPWVDKMPLQHRTGGLPAQMLPNCTRNGGHCACLPPGSLRP